MKRLQINIGDRYGRLTIIKEIEPHIIPCGDKLRQFLCKCDCGNETKVLLSNITHRYTESCGCLNKESMSNVGKNKLIHGESQIAESEYKNWHSMKQRCYNKNTRYWKDWGGRGITVCDRWLNSFPNFLEDMGRKPSPKHTLDRIDNDGNYEPGNCRWATRKEQANNRRPLSVEYVKSLKGRPSPRKGFIMSEEQKNKISLSKKGSIPWNKGIKQKDYEKK